MLETFQDSEGEHLRKKVVKMMPGSLEHEDEAEEVMAYISLLGTRLLGLQGWVLYTDLDPHVNCSHLGNS